MKQRNDFYYDFLDVDSSSNQKIWRACFPEDASVNAGVATFKVPFEQFKPGFYTAACDDLEHLPRKQLEVRFALYAGEVLRISCSFGGELLADEMNPMLDYADDMQREDLSILPLSDGWELVDGDGVSRARICRTVPPSRPWREGLSPMVPDTFRCELIPDGVTSVPVMGWDQFVHGRAESFGLGFVERDDGVTSAMFALHAEPGEHFAGTGERFAQMDLAGKTFQLENTDGMGVNNRRCYKNIPFYLSSRPYGVFINSSYHMRLSLADISTRVAQGLVEEPRLDLFVIGGQSLERVLYNYRRITGFPAPLPLWSYGTWMSRMTYFTADEVRNVARKMREGGFPCDVLHLDTGWFAKDWVCEWLFSETNFPDPAGFMQEMRDDGFRITLWQTHTIGEGNCRLEEAKDRRYLAPLKDESAAAGTGSDFSNQSFAGQIDFSNPEAVDWYKGLLADLLHKGASAIKTDFGEDIDMQADFMGMSAAQLHNMYSLLYQKAAYEVTQAITGDGIIWARAGWAGCQRYPLHWGGDCACSWDGMAGSLRGGLHLGMSGFGFWSHDVPGFHGVPDFMSSWPDDELYVRWTQFGVFTSHLRYHGTSPREPYEYPAIADTVRRWLQLRYALIPYFLKQQERTITSGLPVLRALALHHEKDRAAWSTDDEFYCGDDFLVAPVMNAKRERDVYLPEGKWVDWWTGEVLVGPTTVAHTAISLEEMPIYVRFGAEIPVYPVSVQTTADMDLDKTQAIVVDATFEGIRQSCLGWIFKS